MVDIVDSETRSRMMSNIRGKNTKPELIVRRFLHSQGFRYRLHVKTLPGKPDIVLPKYKTVVFVHGCFWHHHHGCKYAYVPKTNTQMWRSKFKSNVARDRLSIEDLNNLGWRSIIIWECQIEPHQLTQLGKTLANNDQLSALA